MGKQPNSYQSKLEFIGRRRAIEAFRLFELDLASGRKQAGTPLVEYKERAEESLLEFVRLMWPVLEPGRPFVEGWALRAIIEHLEAVSSGQIKKLLINCPPGCMKSLLTNVFWPAWEWGPKNRPDLRVLSFSYKDELSIRDNRRCRTLLESPQYRQLWGDRFSLSGDSRNKKRFDNDRTGFKQAGHVGGGTGERGDRFSLDDPHEVSKAESEARLEADLLWFTETATTRVNDWQSAMVVIMQRLHERDISGLILDKGLGFEHLCLPMRFELGDERARSNIGFIDPRTKEGELLWPERFPLAYLESDVEPRLAAIGGNYAISGQLQQRPVPRGGGMMRKKDFVRSREPPEGGTSVRAWDLAASTGASSAYTCGVLMRRAPSGVFVIDDVVRERGLPHEVEELLARTAQSDGIGIAISLPQDPGQAGKSQKSSLARMLAGFDVHFSPETGAKEVRARPFARQVGAGNVIVAEADWTDRFIAECASFPRGRQRDQVDACSRAFSRLLEIDDDVQVAGPKIIRGE